MICWCKDITNKLARFSFFSEDTATSEHLNNLDRLVVYVDDKSKGEDDSSVTGNMCGYVTKINGALFADKIHIQCVRPQKGRYVLIEAWGSSNTYSRLFSAVLCEVMVYAWSILIKFVHFVHDEYVIFLSNWRHSKNRYFRMRGSCDMYTIFDSDQGTQLLIIILYVYKPYHLLICILPHIVNTEHRCWDPPRQTRKGISSSRLKKRKRS